MKTKGKKPRTAEGIAETVEESPAVAAAPAEPPLSVGSAKVEVTPPLTIPYLAYVPRHEFFEGVHDPLYAKAVVVGDGRNRVALVSVDMIGLARDVMGGGRDFIAEVRERVESTSGIPAGHVSVSATHAHSTPECLGLRSLIRHPGALSWLETLRDQIVSAVVMADRNREPARLKMAVGQVHEVGRSRRPVGKDGKLIAWARAARAGHLVADWGAFDPDVTVLCFETPDGRPRTVLAHFACHPVTVQVQPLVSADFPGAAAAFVEQAGIGCEHCIYLQGASGSINPVRNTSDFSDVRLYGRILGAEIVKQVSILQAPGYPVQRSIVAAASELVSLPSRALPDLGPLEQAEREARKAFDQAPTAGERQKAQWAFLKAEEQAERTRRGRRPRIGEVRAIRLGECVLIGVPGEPFAELGLEFKKLHGTARTLCVGYANGYLGYIAPPSGWKLGGYETSLGTWSVVGPGAFAIILQAARRLVRQLMAT